MCVYMCYLCMYILFCNRAPWKNSLTEWPTLYKYIWNKIKKIEKGNPFEYVVWKVSSICLGLNVSMGQDAFNDQVAPDSKVHGANMGPTCVLSAPAGPHVGPMNLAIRGLSGNRTPTVAEPWLWPQ